jgi:peptide/nickel transport system substrate-binding protein
MKTVRVKRIVSLSLALIMLFSCMSLLISCKTDRDRNVIDNETTHLVLSTQELDGVFNPFYSSSGPDGSVVGMTQIGMLSADKDGKVAYGENEACVVLDYEAVTAADGSQTVYRFVLKNNLKFSNGSPLTMKDVLFNLYVYLDPAYYGSSTIYSTDIIGLLEYRTQSRNESEQDSFNEQFNALAADRVLRLVECIEIVYDDNKGVSLTDAQMTEKLTAVMNEVTAMGGEQAKLYGTVVDDYNLAKEYFRDELEKDYRYNKGTAQDIVFTDKSGNKVTLTTDTEAFLYAEGLIKWDEDQYKFIYSLGEKSKDWTEEQAIDAIYQSYVPNKINEVIQYWATANELLTYFSFLEKQKYFETLDEKIENISGIRYANRTESVTVNGVTYDVPTLDANGAPTSGNEVLEITIKKIDPKAIWNFAFTVAPMYYYSNAEQIAKFDYEKNFGVEFGSIEFQDTVIKDPNKIGVPVGAGAYKATTRTGDSANVTAGTFNELNVVHFERNEHFMFDVKIKYVDYQVVSTNLMLDALYAGDVHMVEPACKQENIDNIASRAAEGFASTAVMTNGYGYIGINAEKIPDIAVRKAIMHAINTQYAVDYYFGYSKSITRPMTKASWAYPDEADAAGQYYKFDDTGATSEQLLIDAGFTKNSKGVYQKGDHVCKYVFTIAGDTTDHPAYMSLKIAAEILNKHGFDIEVRTDINALRKLNNGDLTVWAAAWGAGVDPDMYQVYHMDSTAGSTANWGYRAIKKNAGGKYDVELNLVKDLSEIIDKARETLDESRRAAYYKEALDLVMELAVELPTYQRSDLFAYNTNIIDVNSLTPASELTPYNGPMSRIWEVSLNETK